MKKMICMILALVMVFSLSVSAMADDITTTGDTSKNVTATYTAGSEATNAGAIYSVKLTWTDVNVTYVGGNAGTYTWNPATLKYELSGNSTGNWTDDGITITVENRSNAGITATATYAKTGSEALTFANDGKVTLTSAAVNNGNAIEYNDTNTTGAAQTGTITGKMGGTITEAGELGTITVTLTHE